jgi:hypothetical protein
MVAGGKRMRARPSILAPSIVAVLLAVVISWFALLATRPGDALAHHGSSVVSSALDNGIVKVGIDLNAGGSISYLSPSGSSSNLVNVFDKGRYIQQSYYAGQPLDRRPEGQDPAWSPWPWNPVQGGDARGNSAPVLVWSNDGRTIYVKTQPLLWDMDREMCECQFETWITLEGRVVHVRNKLTTYRTDDRWSGASHVQELPAMYAIGDLSRVMTYTGDKPFRTGSLTQIQNSPSFWETWQGTEHWAACVNAQNFGIGVYDPPKAVFTGGLHGAPGGGEHDSSTCYIAPLDLAALGKRDTYSYDYYLTLGSLSQMRQDVYKLNPTLPDGSIADQTWTFDTAAGLDGWSPEGSVSRAGVQDGALYGRASGDDPTLVSPVVGKSAASLKRVVVKLGNYTSSTRAQLFFQTLASPYWSETKSKTVTIAPDRDFTVYTFDMANVPQWAGTITRLRLDPIATSGIFGVDWIRIAPPKAP